MYKLHSLDYTEVTCIYNCEVTQRQKPASPPVVASIFILLFILHAIYPVLGWFSFLPYISALLVALVLKGKYCLIFHWIPVHHISGWKVVSKTFIAKSYFILYFSCMLQFTPLDYYQFQLLVLEYTAISIPWYTLYVFVSILILKNILDVKDVVVFQLLSVSYNISICFFYRF